MFDVGFKPHQIQDVMEAKVKTWNEALTLLGIMNVNSEKRGAWWLRGQRFFGSGPGVRAVAMNARKYACEHINKMYDLQVDVRWNLDGVSAADAQNAMLPRPALGGSRGDALDKGNPDLGTTDQQELNPNNG